MAPVILGLDFYRQHELILDFTGITRKFYSKKIPYSPPDCLQPIWEETQRNIGAIAKSTTEEFAIPDFEHLNNMNYQFLPTTP